MTAHDHDGSNREPKVLSIALAGALAILAVELWGAFSSGSLALLADGAHMATDAAAAGVALWAAALAGRPVDRKRTFGYGRAKVLAALLNGATLIAVVAYIAWEAVRRLGRPQPISSSQMLIVAAVALAANLVLASYVGRGRASSLNVRAVAVHLMGDALASAGVIAGAVAIRLTGALWIDSAVSLAIAAMVAWSAYAVVRESVNVLLEGVPQGVDVEAVRVALAEVPRILAVHDVHVWSVGGGAGAASLHVRIQEADLDAGPTVVAQIKRLLHERFGVDHSTVEVECDDCGDACE